jgi:hypothetical protein
LARPLHCLVATLLAVTSFCAEASPVIPDNSASFPINDIPRIVFRYYRLTICATRFIEYRYQPYRRTIMNTSLASRIAIFAMTLFVVQAAWAITLI